jgi:hypothetical protein
VLRISVEPLLDPTSPSVDRSKLGTRPNLCVPATLEIQNPEFTISWLRIVWLKLHGEREKIRRELCGLLPMKGVSSSRVNEQP